MTWRRNQRAALLDEVPSGIMVLDRSLHIVDHNQAFAALFGEAKGRPCFSVIKDLGSECPECPARLTFADGQRRVVEETARDLGGRDLHYLAQISPVRAADGSVAFVTSVTTDLTATRRLQHEYQTLFEKVPCFVAVINRDHRVVRANELFRTTFGEPTGEHCYRLYKRRHEPCRECPVDRTLADGGSYSSHQVGTSHDGKATPYLVFTAPLRRDDGEVTHVIEMALDMTEHQHLEEQLSRADVLRLALVEGSLDAILVCDERERVLLVNRAAEKLLGTSREELQGHRLPPGLAPRQLERVISGRRKRALLLDTTVTTAAGEQIPARLAAFGLELDGRFLGAAVIAQDLREIKRLEREKVDAERLAAVGQTVAGLAHGIKNVITGLEGGMYVTSSGMKRGDQERVRQGWEMLVRNISRISELSRSLLTFSRGDRMECGWVRPTEVVREVVALYRDSARQQGVTLEAEVQEGIAPAWMDGQGLHSCVTNLISNAVDACRMSDNPRREISIRLGESDGVILLEVADSGCGMDCEVKQKVFTSFFTTKGKGGSGLGLLLTRKIVQQHGGTIELTSEPGQGTTFRLRFPRHRLPRPPDERRDHE
jgi:PAS domain S-box-containing protein